MRYTTTATNYGVTITDTTPTYENAGSAPIGGWKPRVIARDVPAKEAAIMLAALNASVECVACTFNGSKDCWH